MSYILEVNEADYEGKLIVFDVFVMWCNFNGKCSVFFPGGCHDKKNCGR
jgi:hypothetical protein